MVSVVIRNKNEANALESTLKILQHVYAEDINEIIVVDNNSTDQSVQISEKYNCKVVTIESFTYGKAINLGIENAKNDLVLLLSSHAIPVGNSFFKNTIKAFQQEQNIAGIRYVNSFDNYCRASKNNFLVKDGLNFGIMAACAIVNKEVWQNYKFDELLIASEDKEWSARVIDAGYVIKDFNETFFYHIKRDEQSSLNRWENETTAHYQLHSLKYPSILKITAVFLLKIGFYMPKEYIGNLIYEFQLFFIKLKLKRKIKSE